MSPAVTTPLPFLDRVTVVSSTLCRRIATSLKLSSTSITSSCRPSSVVYSCSTPSISTSVIAAPGIDDSSTRRSALPRVWPKPRSSGSTETLARLTPVCSTCRPRGRRMVVGEEAMNYTLRKGEKGYKYILVQTADFQPARRRSRIAPAGDWYYLEYNSTIRLSLMSLGRSERSGNALSVPANLFASTSTQPGAWSISCDRVSASLIRNWLRDFSTMATRSPGLTAYDGRLTFLPLTSIALCDTNWRACARVTAKPMR